MSRVYKSIVQALKEAMNDAQGNNSLPRKTVEFNNTINSQETPKGSAPINWNPPNDMESNKE